MCACKFKYGSNSVLQRYGITTPIPATDFSAGSTNASFQFIYCISPTKFNEKLSSIKVKAPNGKEEVLSADTRKDVEILAGLHDNNTDVKSWGIDIKERLETIKFTNEELNNASCKVGFNY